MKTLTIGLNEKDIENTYRAEMLKRFVGSKITSPFGCDGFLVSNDDKIRTLLEFKFDVDMLDRSDEFKEFRDLYKALEERMRPLVYELGFLLK